MIGPRSTEQDVALLQGTVDVQPTVPGPLGDAFAVPGGRGRRS
ncbi:hypothetical protein [Cellulomonas sp. Leaf395]|nr:hypothetical protein [Cellulomonas sp. Leaf395]